MKPGPLAEWFMPGAKELREANQQTQDLEAQLTEARRVLREVRQKVHQAHHLGGEPTKCREGICNDIAQVLGEKT